MVTINSSISAKQRRIVGEPVVRLKSEECEKVLRQEKIKRARRNGRAKATAKRRRCSPASAALMWKDVRMVQITVAT